MRQVPETANRQDWPRLVAKAINRLQALPPVADGNISNVALAGTSLDFTGSNGGFNGSVDLSSLSGGSGFAPADISESDATYIYFGFNSGWRVRRVLRVDGTADEALAANNGAYATLAEAWPNRASLSYT